MNSVVIALGGNALPAAAGGGIERAMMRQMEGIGKIAADNRMRVALTHGNGPQVGDEMIRNEYSRGIVNELPMHLINAATQATVGAAIEEYLMGSLAKRGSDRHIATVITHVLVNARKGKERAVKQIGPFYRKGEIAEKSDGKDYVKVGKLYRRVVWSPRPVAIMEIGAIKTLFEGGDIVIACGGGGIPVYRKRQGYAGAEGVIDKDRTTSLLATSLKAERMVILTNEDYVYRNFPERELPIRRERARDIERIMKGFDEGTMRPKVEAAVSFIRNGGKEAVIGNINMAEDVVSGEEGTTITR